MVNTGAATLAAPGAVGLLRAARLERLGRDRDLARLGLLGLRDADLEHAAVEVGLDGFGVDAVGQGQRARERPEGALHAVVALLAGLVLGLALPGDGEH